MFNPFKFGDVVGDSAFCNRVTELQDILTYVQNSNKVFLYSERRFGKTSLVKKVLRDLDPTVYLTSYVDLWKTNSQKEFADNFATAMMKSLATTPQKMAETTKDFFSKLNPVATYKPDGSVSFKVEPSKVISSQTLEDILAIPQEIAKQRRKKVVVALDEIQEISDYENDAVERYLRSCIQNQADVSYIFMGSRKHLMREMTMTASRPLFGAGAHYELPPIESKHWIPFIMGKFNNNGSKTISEKVITELLKYTDKQPLYTQQLCFELWELTPQFEDATAQLLEAAVAKTLKQENARHAAQWRKLSKTNKTAILEISKSNKTDDESALESLMDLELIDYDEKNAPYIVDRFFGLWIQITQT